MDWPLFCASKALLDRKVTDKTTDETSKRDAFISKLQRKSIHSGKGIKHVSTKGKILMNYEWL
jgi:hypothetical protein